MPIKIVITVHFVLAGAFLVPMKKTAHKSHRMKCCENVKMPVVLCEGWV